MWILSYYEFNNAVQAGVTNKHSMYAQRRIIMSNYFNTLNLRQQLAQLGQCRFMGRDEFADESGFLKGKTVDTSLKTNW